MFNISKISYSSVAGKILRFPLKLIPSNTVIPILQGSLKNKKWIKGSSINGCWFGTYEYKKQKLFNDFIKPGMVIYDIGANVGFYSLLSSVLTGENGKVFSFEPFPNNVKYLTKHIKLNTLQNVVVVEKAVTNLTGILKFSVGKNNSVGHLSENGELEVNSISIDEYIAQGNPSPDIIKMDIEGAEYDALVGAKKLLYVRKPIIFLATHGNEVKKNCIKLLEESGYKINSIDNRLIEESDEFLCKAF